MEHKERPGRQGTPTGPETRGKSVAENVQDDVHHLVHVLDHAALEAAVAVHAAGADVVVFGSPSSALREITLLKAEEKPAGREPPNSNPDIANLQGG